MPRMKPTRSRCCLKAVTKRPGGGSGDFHGLVPLCRCAEGDVIGVDRFGASAPGGLVMEKFGFTVDNVVSKRQSSAGLGHQGRDRGSPIPTIALFFQPSRS
jgi:hypothetical protein